jgi:hypothetical protein
MRWRAGPLGSRRGQGLGHDRLDREVVLPQLAEEALTEHQVDRRDVVDAEMEQVAGRQGRRPS